MTQTKPSTWRTSEVLYKLYYYCYMDRKFFCISADHINDGVPDESFVFQVREQDQMSKASVDNLRQRLGNLFPELKLAEIDFALNNK